MDRLYAYNDQINVLSDEQVRDAVFYCEKRLRTSKFKYTEYQAFMDQVEEIKTIWPDSVREFIRKKAKEISGKDPITPTSLRKAILSTCSFIAQERAKLSGRSESTEATFIAGETTLATLFHHAPEGSLTSVPLSKTYQPNGPTIRVKTSLVPRKLVVDEKEVETADYYVLALFLEESKTAVLLGFATKEDLKLAKKGNKNTDQFNCQWREMAYYLPLELLRPMSELYETCGLREIPSFISMESVPKIKDIPIIVSKSIQDMIKPRKEEFQDSLFVPEKALKGKQ